MTSIVAGIVEVYVFRRVKGRPQYLLLRRSDSETLYPGIWQVVTGTVEAGETAVAAARRELGEETRLPVKRLWTVPGVGAFYDASADAVRLCPQFAVEVAGTAEPVLSEEHQSYRWTDLRRAKAMLTWPGQRQAVQIVHDVIVGERRMPGLTEIHFA